MATGDFVHFLDSDNLLLPTAVSRKVDAFARITDAELCYSLAEITGDLSLSHPRIPPPDGSARCPTTSMLASVYRYPFYVSCVMVPRWTLLDSDEFDEDLRRGEDRRFWVALALRDTKAIGLNARLTIRRLARSSISADPALMPLSLVVQARNMADFLRYRRGWVLAAQGFPGVLYAAMEGGFRPPTSGLLAQSIADILDAVNELGDGKHRDGMSPLPLLAHLRHLAQGAIDRSRQRGSTHADFLEPLFAAIDRATKRAAPIRRPDVAFWAGAVVSSDSKARVNSFLRRIEAQLDGDPALLALSEQLLRRSALIPHKRTIDAYVRLRRWRMPPRLAMWLAVRFAGAPGQPPAR